MVELARRLVADYPRDPDDPTGASNVLRTGVAEVYNDLTPALVEAGARDAAHLALLRALNLSAVMIVPMKARGRVLGLVTFASSATGARFTDEDLTAATKLADRAALAVDNARLYSDAHRSRARLELALEAGRMGAWEYDVARDAFTWTAALAALHGTDVASLTPTLEGYLATIHPDDREAARASIAAALDGDVQHLREYRILRADGTVRWVEARGRVLRDASGAPVTMVGVRVDITERKRAEEKLAEERGRLAVTLTSIGDAVIATDARGVVTLLNPVAESLTGWTGPEAMGRPLQDVFRIFSEKTGRRVPDPVEKVLATGRIVGLANHTQIEARDGTRRAIADSAAPIRGPDGQTVGVVLVFRDVTHDQLLERELAKASKLESIGVLAGGIAHDFNNILTSISANVSLAERRIPREHPSQKRLEAALVGCERARDLTRQLLTFSRGGAPIKTATSVRDVLRESCGFALQGSPVRPRYEMPEDLWPIDADAGQIAQVVHNLALNAAQAMPAGGHLTVVASNADVDGETWLPLPPGRYVRMAFADDGPGISPEDLGRIFDPFFTTKAHGSGLGLATAFSIVQRHDGHITVESTPGRGTTFTVYVPASLGEVAETARAALAEAGGRGRVLVMDDDDAIRELAAECLADLGYEAELVRDGHDAIVRYADAHAEGRPFDVVIVDLTVPGGLGGRETVRALRERFPEVRAIVSSGYSNDPIMAAFRDHGFAGVIQKPFVVNDLARVLAEILAPLR
jgi:PAS domain S-box-containing protein